MTSQAHTNVTMRVSNSRLKTFRRCPNQYRYKYIMGLRPRKRKDHLERGTWIHDLLMVHYDGEDWRARHLELKRKFSNLFEEEREELGDLPTECGRIMRSYLRTYGQTDKRYITVDSELDEIVTLPNGVRLHMVVDLIVWDTHLKGLWIWDHKTRKSFEELDNITLDPQGTLYYDGLTVMGYEGILGFMANEIRTKAPAIPDVLVAGGLSKRKNIDTDVWTYMREIKRRGLDPRDYADILESIAVRQKDRFFRRVAIPKDPTTVSTLRREALQTIKIIELSERKKYFPRTYDKSCAWGCDYRDLCIAELRGGDIKPMIRQNFKSDKEME